MFGSRSALVAWEPKQRMWIVCREVILQRSHIIAYILGAPYIETFEKLPYFRAGGGAFWVFGFRDLLGGLACPGLWPQI